MTGDDPTRRRDAVVAGYHEAFATHHDPARRVGWRGARDQALRFAVCCDALTIATLRSVLDVGCGEGDLAPFLRRRGFTGEYLGIDLLPSMVSAARARHLDERFECVDLAASKSLLGRFDLVVACGTLSLRVGDPDRHLAESLHAMWDVCERALVVVAPSERGRRHHLVSGASGDDPFVYFSSESLRRRLSTLSPWVVVREDFLATDVAGIVYRAGAGPLVEALLAHGEIDRVGAAWLYLEQGAPQRALEALGDAGGDDDAEAWLRRGQACKRLGWLDEARQALERALTMSPGLTEAQLELEGL